MKKLAIFLTVMAYMSGGVASADLNDGLMAYYSFNGDASDKSGNGNHGTVYGGAEYVSGVIGQAVRFDGTDDYINVKASPSLNPANQLTIVFWSRIDSIPQGWAAVLHKEGAYEKDFPGAETEYSVMLWDQLYLVSGGDKSSPHKYGVNIPPVGKWFFYAGIADRKNHLARIYINSILKNEDTDSYASFNNNNADLKIGWPKILGGTCFPFHGVIDELRLYNRVLSESEIMELYMEQYTYRDSDGDGVIDLWDMCPDTPKDSCTDKNGCVCKDSYMQEQPNQICDINNDGRTGLEEAIHALQITAGINKP